MNKNSVNKEGTHENRSQLKSRFDGDFNKAALENITSSDDLDILFTPIKRSPLFAYIALTLLFLSLLIWLFWGAVSLTVSGKGVVFNKYGLFTIQSNRSGVIESILVQPKQKIEIGQPLANISGEVIASNLKGTILEVFVRPGNYLGMGSPLMLLEPSTEGEMPYIVFAFIPVEDGKGIQVGMNVNVEVSTVKVSDYGVIEGKVIDVSPYAVSHEYIAKLLKNEGLVPYLTNGLTTVTLLTIALQENPLAPSGYKWSSGLGPDIKLSLGTIVSIKGILAQVPPFYYYFPIWRLEKLRHDLEKWWYDGRENN